MISILESDFTRVKQLLQHSHIPTFVHAVIDRTIPGFVYSDANGSKTFLIGTQTGILYVFGEETNCSFNKGLLEFYQKRVSEKARFTLFSSSEKWDRVIQELLNVKVSKISRYSYHYNQLANPRIKRDLPPGYTIKKIDAYMINKSTEYNEKYYKEYWGSVSHFLNNGFGYVILHHDEVVSECTSIFGCTHVAEIDIETHADYRGKGLALTAAQAFIDHCIENNVTPCWNCDVNNQASIQLAYKMGFENPQKYSIFVNKKLGVNP